MRNQEDLLHSSFFIHTSSQMRRSTIVGGIAFLLVVQLGILAGYAVVLLRTELAAIPSTENAQRLSPFLEFGRTVDKWASTFYRAPAQEETLPMYGIDIAPEQWGRMLQSLPADSSSAPIDADQQPWVPAIFHAEGQEWNAHVRVITQSPAHWSWPKKSFDLRFPNDEPFHSMRRLQLLLPEERGWLSDVLLVDRSEELGLLHPAVSFVDVRLNGRGPMVYLAREGWSQDFAERQGRGGDSVLYRASAAATNAGADVQDAAYWEREGSEGARVPDDALGLLTELSRHGAEVDPDYLTKLGQVMDLDRLASAMALRLLMGNPVAEPDELRLLYARGKFEPVLWRINLAESRSILAPSGIPLLDAAMRVPSLRSRAQAMLHDYLLNHAADDQEFFRFTRSNIEAPLYADQWKLPSNRIVRNALRQQQALLERGMRNISEQLATAEVLINERIPLNEQDALLVIDANARGPTAAFLASIAFPPRYAGHLQKRKIRLMRDTGDGVYGSGDLPVPVVVTGSVMRLPSGQERLLWPGNPAVSGGEVLRLPHRRHRFYIIADTDVPRLTVDALPLPVDIGNAVTGGSGQIIGTALVDDRVYGTILPPKITRSEFLKLHPQFTSADGNGVGLKGTVTLEGIIAVPADIALTVAPGTRIRMGSGASLLAFGSISMLGEEAAPITIGPANEQISWGTIAIIDAPEPSDLHYVTIEGGKGATAVGKTYPGSVTFAGSPGSITHVTVTDAEGESAIALSQVFVDVRDTNIQKSVHHGILVESALAGRIERVTILQSSGHAIALRGSPVVIRDSIIDVGAQACVYATERSTPFLERSRLRECAVGVLADNGAHVVARDVIVVANTVGLAARGGSAAFGPGSVIANDSMLTNNGTDTQVQSGGVVAVE